MKLLPKKFPVVMRTTPSVLQINVGKKCNQVCTHCHVSAGPDRTEDLDEQTADEIIDFAKKYKFKVADITGGAPEINAQFPKLLANLSELCDKVIVRCNLTAALSRKKRVEELFVKYRPEVVASMPCYEAENVDKQRGDGVFEKSIKALQWLNSLGFGREHELTLVYNPLKPVLPPDSASLEIAYKKILKERFDLDFTRLIAIANVPIGRYEEELRKSGLYNNYLNLLREHHNEENIESLMCRTHINVDWQGRVFDCDFNNQIELHPLGRPVYLKDLDLAEWLKQPIAVKEHCFTCTAGCGSSCGGSLNS
jgi:radical SAM/Cys-rich protein